MIYAKIDENGDVIEFPYNDRRLRRNEELLENIVEVDAQTNKPTVKWDQKIYHDRVERMGDGTYVLHYQNPVPKFDSPEKRSENITALKKQKESLNQRLFNARMKTLNESNPTLEDEAYEIQYENINTLYQNNVDILAQIDLTDESTWDLIDSIKYS